MNKILSRLALLAAALLLVPACGSDSESDLPASVSITQPAGTQRIYVVIAYTLSHPQAVTASIAADFSLDGGLSWDVASPAPVGEGTSGLATSASGTPHTFTWYASIDGIGITSPTKARIRITFQETGASASTADFSVDNNTQQFIGVAQNVFPRDGTLERTAEAAIGNLTVDAMRLRYGTKLAIIDGGSIRTPLPSSFLPFDTTLRRTTAGYAAGPPYDLVVGDTYSAYPFGNRVVTRTITGAQLWTVLEQSVGQMPVTFGGFLQISGFKFTYSLSAPVGSRVQSVTLTTAPNTAILADSTVYSLALTDFLNAGGVSYTTFADGTGVFRDTLADVVLDYIQGVSTVTPSVGTRITQIP